MVVLNAAAKQSSLRSYPCSSLLWNITFIVKNLKEKCVMWGHTDLNLRQSNIFSSASSPSRHVYQVKKNPESVPEILCSQEREGCQFTVILTVDHLSQTRSSLSLRGCLCQTERNSLLTFLKYYIHKNRKDIHSYWQPANIQHWGTKIILWWKVLQYDSVIPRMIDLVSQLFFFLCKNYQNHDDETFVRVCSS